MPLHYIRKKTSAFICMIAASIPILFLLGNPVLSLADGDRRSFTFSIIGDVPPSHTDLKQLNNLIDGLNNNQSSFTVHVGDLFDQGYCEKEHFINIRESLNRIEQALIYVPGDNEWIDCQNLDWKPSIFYKIRAHIFSFLDIRWDTPLEGRRPYVAIKRIRNIFYADEYSLGRNKLKLERQSKQKEYSEYKENQRWLYNGVMFVTVNVTGRINNYYTDRDEHLKRTKANIAWINESFRFATDANVAGIAFFMHELSIEAINEEVLEKSKLYYTPAYQSIIDAFNDASLQFKKAVLIVTHAHSHTGFSFDKPFNISNKAILNMNRITAFNSDEVHIVEVLVDPNNPEPFTARALIVEQNRHNLK